MPQIYRDRPVLRRRATVAQMRGSRGVSGSIEFSDRTGATPLEAFLGLDPAHRAAVEPPRGLPGERSAEPSFQIVYLDLANRKFPVLKPTP